MLSITEHGTTPWDYPRYYQLTYNDITFKYFKDVDIITNRAAADELLSIHGYQVTGLIHDTYKGLRTLIAEYDSAALSILLKTTPPCGAK